MIVERIVDSGFVPEVVLRATIRAVCALRLREQRDVDPLRIVEELRKSDLRVEADAANAQHYEVPASFFQRTLGPHLKYSSCYWPPGTRTLEQAEVAMLELTTQRAQLADGQDVLELGCGWGSLSLWIAAKFPKSHVTAVSNSRTQRTFIEARAAERGLTNIQVITKDVGALDLYASRFDRVVSIEMFEHMRNYERLLQRIAVWLRPTGSLFVHVFAHERYAYTFDNNGQSDWMAREFFTGGIMPSAGLFRHFQDHLKIVDEWRLSGMHYAKTAEAWHDNLLAHRADIDHIFGDKRQFHRWRVFFLACAELFGYRNGTEWLVAHYRWEKK